MLTRSFGRLLLLGVFLIGVVDPIVSPMPVEAACISAGGDLAWEGTVVGGDGAAAPSECPAIFQTQVQALLNLLTGPIAITVVLVSLIAAGLALIIGGGELKDLAKTALNVVIIGSVVILSVQVAGYFFGGTGSTTGMLLPPL